MFHTRHIRRGFSALQFFTTCIKPLVWPYPLVPLVQPKNYDLMRSPFPIVGCIRDDFIYVVNNWTTATEPNLVHVDIDNNYCKGKPAVDLESLFIDSKQLHRLRHDYESLRACMTDDMQVTADSSTGRQAIELINMIRQLLTGLYMFDCPDIGNAKNRHAAVVGRSKIDASILKVYTSTQMFTNYHTCKQ